MPAKAKTRIGLLDDSLAGSAEPPPGDRGILQGRFGRGRAAFVPPAEQRRRLKTRTFRTKARDDIPMRPADLLDANGAVLARPMPLRCGRTARPSKRTCSDAGARRTGGARSKSGAGASNDSPMEDGAGGRMAAPRPVREHDR
jgi:hypothetical protein